MRTLSRHARFGTLILASLALGCESSVEPTPGGSAEIVLESGAAQGANVGSTLSIAPAVRVLNNDGQPVEGVSVTFEALTGSGSITGSSAMTDATGRAAVGSWTLGSVGENVIRARVNGVQPLLITAVGRCVAGTTLPIDASATGSLASGDCRFSGNQLTDRYTFTTTTQRAVRFTQHSAFFDAFLELQGAGNIVATNNDSSTTTDNASFRVLLAPGSYDLHPSSLDASRTGSYTVLASAAPESEPGCEALFTVPGISTVQAIANDDCVDGSYRFDEVVIYLHAGRTYVFNMSSATIDSFLELYQDGANQPMMQHDDISASNINARISVDPPVSGYYLLRATTALAANRGSYTLTIE